MQVDEQMDGLSAHEPSKAPSEAPKRRPPDDWVQGHHTSKSSKTHSEAVAPQVAPQTSAYPAQVSPAAQEAALFSQLNLLNAVNRAMVAMTGWPRTRVSP
jgi:hypothetical protein